MRSKEIVLVAGQQKVNDYNFFSKMKIDGQVSGKYKYARHLYRDTLGIML